MFNSRKLEELEPEKWKNVGVSLIQAVRALKDTQVETVSSLQTMKQLLEQFTEMTFKYQKQTDTVLDQIAKKGKQDIALSEKNIELQLKSMRLGIDESMKGTMTQINGELFRMEKAVKRNEDLVNQTEPTHKVLEKVKEIYDSPIEKIKSDHEALKMSLDQKILKIYKDELWENDKFGPSLEIPSLKSYVLRTFKEQHQSHIDAFNRAGETINAIKAQLSFNLEQFNEDIVPRLQILERQAPKTLQSLTQLQQGADQLKIAVERVATDLHLVFDVCDIEFQGSQQQQKLLARSQA